MLSIITMPETSTTTTGFIDSTLGHIGTVFTDVYLIIALAIGLPLAFWFIGRIIGLIRARG